MMPSYSRDKRSNQSVSHIGRRLNGIHLDEEYDRSRRTPNREIKHRNRRNRRPSVEYRYRKRSPSISSSSSSYYRERSPLSRHRDSYYRTDRKRGNSSRSRSPLSRRSRKYSSRRSPVHRRSPAYYEQSPDHRRRSPAHYERSSAHRRSPSSPYERYRSRRSETRSLRKDRHRSQSVDRRHSKEQTSASKKSTGTGDDKKKDKKVDKSSSKRRVVEITKRNETHRTSDNRTEVEPVEQVHTDELPFIIDRVPRKFDSDDEDDPDRRDRTPEREIEYEFFCSGVLGRSDDDTKNDKNNNDKIVKSGVFRQNRPALTLRPLVVAAHGGNKLRGAGIVYQVNEKDGYALIQQKRKPTEIYLELSRMEPRGLLPDVGMHVHFFADLRPIPDPAVSWQARWARRVSANTPDPLPIEEKVTKWEDIPLLTGLENEKRAPFEIKDREAVVARCLRAVNWMSHDRIVINAPIPRMDNRKNVPLPASTLSVGGRHRLNIETSELFQPGGDWAQIPIPTPQISTQAEETGQLFQPEDDIAETHIPRPKQESMEM